MNNEIKEILAYFEEYVKITDMHDSEPMLNWKDLKIVLDYITNLQEENQRLKSDKAYAIGYIKNNYNKFTEIEIEKDGIKEKRYISDFNIKHLLNILGDKNE